MYLSPYIRVNYDFVRHSSVEGVDTYEDPCQLKEDFSLLAILNNIEAVMYTTPFALILSL